MKIFFSYDRPTGTAEARLFSMFKFPDSNRVHFQCDIVLLKIATYQKTVKNLFVSSQQSLYLYLKQDPFNPRQMHLYSLQTMVL